MLTYHDHTARLVAQSVPQGATVFEPTRHARRRPDARARAPVRNDRFDSLHKAPTAGIEVLQLIAVEAVNVVARLTQPGAGSSPTHAHHLKRPSQTHTHFFKGRGPPRPPGQAFVERRLFFRRQSEELARALVQNEPQGRRQLHGAATAEVDLLAIENPFAMERATQQVRHSPRLNSFSHQLSPVL